MWPHGGIEVWGGDVAPVQRTQSIARRPPQVNRSPTTGDSAVLRFLGNGARTHYSGGLEGRLSVLISIAELTELANRSRD
jgi:hypothetical protein